MLWTHSSQFNHRVDALLRELANLNLHDIPANLPFRIELWDHSAQQVRWIVAASSNVTIAHAGLNAAIANYPKLAVHDAQRHSRRSRARPARCVLPVTTGAAISTGPLGIMRLPVPNRCHGETVEVPNLLSCLG
jgi:hypothetical protein